MADLLGPHSKVKSTHAEVAYTSGWIQGQVDNSGHNLGDKYATTSIAGETITIQNDSLAFTDAVLFVFGSQTAGILQVKVDGVLQKDAQGNTDIDCYLYIDGQANAMKNAAMIHLTGLTRSTHKIEIISTGRKGQKSFGTTVGFNYAYLLDPDTPLGFPMEGVILWMGDSNSDRKDGYCDTQFKTILNALRPGNRVRHQYATRPSGSSDYIRFLRNEIIAKNPALVSQMLGTNDLPRPEIITKDNIENAIKICQQDFGIPIQLCTILPRYGLNEYSWNKVNLQIRELVSKYNVPLVDLNIYINNNVTTTTTPMMADGIHLDAVGDNLAAHHLFDVMMSTGHPFRKLLG